MNDYIAIVTSKVAFDPLQSSDDTEKHINVILHERTFCKLIS